MHSFHLYEYVNGWALIPPIEVSSLKAIPFGIAFAAARADAKWNAMWACLKSPGCAWLPRKEMENYE